MTLPANMRQIATEYTNDGMAGGDVSQKRIIMRSPSAVFYVCYGGILWSPRDSSAMSHSPTIVRDKVTPAALNEPSVRQRLDDAFGPGATDAAILAVTTRGMGTILVDGGGKPFGPTRAQQREYMDVRAQLVSPTREIDLTGQVETCRQCGGGLPIRTQWYNLGYEIRDDHPTTLEDCQRFSNQRVVAARGYRDSKRDHYVESFQTWDGESYTRKFFCSDSCAATYGMRAAAELPPLPVGGEAPKLAHDPHSSINLYEEKERTIEFQGKIIKI